MQAEHKAPGVRWLYAGPITAAKPKLKDCSPHQHTMAGSTVMLANILPSKSKYSPNQNPRPSRKPCGLETAFAVSSLPEGWKVGNGAKPSPIFFTCFPYQAVATFVKSLYFHANPFSAIKVLSAPTAGLDSDTNRE